MGSSGSKACRDSSAAVVGEAEAASSGGGRRRRSRTHWGFQSSCLGSPSASHDSDEDEQVSNVWMRKRQGSTSRQRMMLLEQRNREDVDCYGELKDKNFENERHCMSSNELELDDCGEASICNMPIRNGSSGRASSTQSLSTPGRIFSHFRFNPGNASSRVGRSSSSRSLNAYPVSSSCTMLNDRHGVAPPSESTNINESPQGISVLPASHFSRACTQGCEVSPGTLPLNCPAYHLSNDPQHDQITSSIDNTRDFGAMGVQADASVRSPRATNDINCSDAAFLDRRPGGREPSERNVRFSRTLSVGRLRDRVLRRSSLSDFAYRPPQQEGEDSDAVSVGRGLVTGSQVRASVAEDNPVTLMSFSGQSPSSISRSLFGVQGHEMQTPHAREGRYQDLLEHRSNFLERRRRIRSQVRALQRLGSRFENVSGHDSSCVLAGQNQTGHCTCRVGNHNASTTGENNTRASISRIVMLAEALFEVLDEIHQQSVVLSSQPSVSPIGSVPAPNDVVDSLPMKLYTKLHRERNEETSQCYICLLEYEEGDTIRVLPCHHEFHRACVDKWLKEIHRVCPLCRGDICKYDSSSEQQ